MNFPRALVSFKQLVWLSIFASGVCLSALGEVRLPSVFSDHMVLQQGKSVQIWGWAVAGEKVEVEIAGQKVSTTANAKGEWRIALSALKAGGPYTLTVRGLNKLEFTDVLIGEVWLCSGQSNMEMGVALCDGAEQAIAAADQPQIRLLPVPNRWMPQPQSDIEATWRVCTPTSVKDGGWAASPLAPITLAANCNRS
ncbi:MAG: hypothetical protein QM813_06625 [Verrucomicrobiota bacterium]